MTDNEFYAAVSRFPWGRALRARRHNPDEWRELHARYMQLRELADTPHRLRYLNPIDVLGPFLTGLGDVKRPRAKPKMRDAVLTTALRKRLASIPR